MTSSPPPPNVHVSATSPISEIFTPGFTEILIFTIIGAVIVIGVSLLYKRIRSKNVGNFLRINYNNADAIFIIAQPKMLRLYVVPAKAQTHGLYIGTKDGQYFIIAVKEGIVPFQLENIKKPVYFAVGQSSISLGIKMESLTGMALVNTFSDKSLTEVIANILNGTAQLDGKIPIANAYNLAFSLALDKATLLDIIEYMTSSADTLMSMQVAVAQEMTKIQKIQYELSKLNAFASNRRLYLIFMGITMIAMAVGILYYLMTSIHH